jgi:hypothetical protein
MHHITGGDATAGDPGTGAMAGYPVTARYNPEPDAFG